MARQDFQSAAPALYVLMASMVLDTIMGLLIAFGTKQMSSSASWRGVTKKMGVLLIVAFAAVVDPFIPTVPLALFVSLFYIVPEGLSIFENAGKLGIPIPAFMREALVKLGDDAEDSAAQRVKVIGTTAPLQVSISEDNPPQRVVVVENSNPITNRRENDHQ
jgi:toxin secretion/phage lysis holin